MDNTITFNKQVINDAFADMPLSSQLFYFYLLMNADREGFVSNPKALQRLTGTKECDMEILSIKSGNKIKITEEKVKNWLSKGDIK